MHVESMRDFLVFSRYMNFSRAARILNVSQPTLSYRVSKLEKELGFDLIDHAPRPRLTAAGKCFVRYAESVVVQYEDMLEECRNVASSDGGTVVFEHPVCFEQTRQEIESFCADFSAEYHAGVRYVRSHASLFDVLEGGQVDVGFMWSHPEFVEEETGALGYVHLPVSRHPEVRFYMRKENPLATKDVLEVEDLDGKKVVLPLSIRYATFDEAAANFMQHEGVDMRIVHKSETYRDIELGLAADELAFSMEDLGSHEDIEREYGLVSKPIRPVYKHPEPYLVYHLGNENPALEYLLRYVESVSEN